MKKEQVFGFLKEGKISIGKAAELLGVSLYEMIDLLPAAGVYYGYTEEELERDVRRFRLRDAKPVEP